MGDPTAFGDVPLIVDTSALCRVKHAPVAVRDDFQAAVNEGLVVTCPVVWLEYLHHAETRAEFDQYDRELSALHSFPVTEAICASAENALRELRVTGTDGNHRVMAPDALVAATAALNRVNVLHDDKHYAKLAFVLDFEAIRFGPF